jgi:hypothetical protein
MADERWERLVEQRDKRRPAIRRVMNKSPLGHVKVAQTERNQPMRLITIAVLFAVTLGMAQAESRSKKEKRERHESHNYIIERQQAGLVRGVPISRRIIGKREIDIYPNGLMFEKNNLVGVQGR